MATPPSPSASPPSGAAPGGTSSTCPPGDLIVHVRKDTASGVAVAGANVTISGPERRSGVTDAAGNVSFLHLKPGVYSVAGRAKTYLPSPVKRFGVAPPGGKGDATLIVSQPVVVRIDATVRGTPGVRRPTVDTHPDKTHWSGSDSEDLTVNGPTVLVRGCRRVKLHAITNPLNFPVTWQVKPNQNTRSAPVITPKDGGKKAELKTDVTGSFSVIASQGGKKIVWTVVFVDVHVYPKTSRVAARKNGYVDDGSGSGLTRFRSGTFASGSVAAWEASVAVRLTGGGTDGKLGLTRITLHILQNGVADTMTGNYAPGHTALEVPHGGLPVLDSNGLVDAAGNALPCPTNWFADLTMTLTGSAGDLQRIASFDSPTGSFPTAHQNTGTALTSISGVNGFVACVAATSSDAPDTTTVHAKIAWHADYAGAVNAAGVYTRHGAHTTSDAKWARVSPATGGLEADRAHIETFEPRFNEGTNTTWTP